MSWMTDPKRRKVQLKANPTAFQYGPSNPSSTSNHWFFFFIPKKKVNKKLILFINLCLIYEKLMNSSRTEPG